MGDNVAILGLGTMGTGMAANLLKTGFSVTVYNRTAAKAKPLTDAGARFGSTPAEAVKDRSVIISMLADDTASREVWLGKDGALAATRKGAILIESSTVSPQWIAEFAKLAEQHGADLLDAPVTGSPHAGRSWPTFISGRRQRCQPVGGYTGFEGHEQRDHSPRSRSSSLAGGSPYVDRAQGPRPRQSSVHLASGSTGQPAPCRDLGPNGQ